MLAEDRKKITGDNTQQLCKSKSSVSMENSITRRTVHMPLVMSSNITYTKSSRVSDKSLAPDVLLRKILTQGKYWPIETMKTEVQRQLHYWYHFQLVTSRDYNITLFIFFF